MGDEEKQALLQKPIMIDEERQERVVLQRKRSSKMFKRCVSNANDELKSFRRCLRWMCVDQSNKWWVFVSWVFFLVLGIIVPLSSHYILSCSNCDGKHHRPYDGVVQLSLSSVATLSFLCLSTFVRKYGFRRFLFLDKLYAESEKVRDGYTAQLNRSLELLAWFVLPSFAAESAYKIWWYGSGASQIPFLGNVYLSDAIACVLELCSWLYRTAIFFLVCVLFRLICYLQILRLQDFSTVFQEESDVGSVLKEHLRIRRQLRIISHRYRSFIMFALIIVTASQFASLLITTRSHAEVNIFRTGEIALCSLTLVAGLFILFRAATKITHKAQAITSLAAKWHICATLDSFDSSGEYPTTPEMPNASSSHAFPSTAEDVESEDESGEGDEIDSGRIMTPTYSSTVSYQKRQALVTYFENNEGGISVFGFMLDRSSLHALFMIEMSLVLWLLGKTVGIS